MATIMSGSEHSIMFFPAPSFDGIDWQFTSMSLSGLFVCRCLFFEFGEDSCFGLASSSRESILTSESSVRDWWLDVYRFVICHCRVKGNATVIGGVTVQACPDYTAVVWF
mgnify:FL=1